MKPISIVLLSLAVALTGASAWPQQKQPAKPDADVQAVVKGNNEFAFDLYKRLAEKEKGNIVFSPYSISTALAMTYAGARGETAKEMAKVLHFNLGQDRLHPAFGALVADQQKDDTNGSYELRVANSLWGQKRYPFKAEFLRTTLKNYIAGLKEVDFQNDADESRQAINRWVEKQTKNLIKELLLKPDITSNTRLVLTNAIYFKATWTNQFSKNDTKDALFELSPGENILVPMMHHHHPSLHFKYFAGVDFQWLELPYKGDRLSMVLLLPQKKGRLAELEKTLTAAALKQGIAKLERLPGTVALPRFKTTCRMSLAETLSEMGMPLAFGARADLSGIAEGLNIAQLIHKAFIDVDEVGTEAAVASAISANQSLIPPFSFRADHPFLFLIRDVQTGSILFQGRLADPRPGRP